MPLKLELEETSVSLIQFRLVRNCSYLCYETPHTATATFYRDITPIGSLCAIECSEERFLLVKVNWGAEEDFERSRDGEVELSWVVKDGALTRLKKICNNAKNPNEIIQYLHERFASFERQAGDKLIEWLEKKSIPYYYDAHY